MRVSLGTQTTWQLFKNTQEFKNNSVPWGTKKKKVIRCEFPYDTEIFCKCCSSSNFFFRKHVSFSTFFFRGESGHDLPLSQIMQSAPHLGRAQGSAHLECDGWALLGENHLSGHGISPSRPAFYGFFWKMDIIQLISVNIYATDG